MNLLSSNLRQRSAWAEIVAQLLHQPGGRWQETELENNDITLMIPRGGSYTVLRLLLFSAVDVGTPSTMQRVGELDDLCREDRSQVSEAKIVYALETGTAESGNGDSSGEEKEKEKGLEGYMKLQVDLLSTQQPSLSSIPILPISQPTDLPSLLASLQQPPPTPAPTPAPLPAHAHVHHLPHNYHHPPSLYQNSYIPSRDTLLPLCTVRSRNQPFRPLSPHSVAILSGPIFINFPGLRDLLELVETGEGKDQIRTAMVRAFDDDDDNGEMRERARVEAEKFLAFWEHEFGV
ncbi:hypothetical protein B0T20DRAFT_420279 [Sordaria brevicollis]|uniref:Uncharacterized protein n=1 Tax=Sordaria brevicollis TaxID=83679 RepID=A0AAE0U9G9_SORBR|nr:hypothetical protein B0T20DRAFT_420279 [Sordaria brevicollis]